MPALEATINHIQSDVTEMKPDIRRLDAKIDAQRGELSAKIDQQRTDLSAKIDQQRTELGAKIDALAAEMRQSHASLSAEIKQWNKVITDVKVWRWADRTWALIVGGAILSVMARAFKWI